MSTSKDQTTPMNPSNNTTCSRCGGTGKVVSGGNIRDGQPVWGSKECPNCNGTGHIEAHDIEPDIVSSQPDIEASKPEILDGMPVIERGNGYITVEHPKLGIRTYATSKLKPFDTELKKFVGASTDELWDNPAAKHKDAEPDYVKAPTPPQSTDTEQTTQEFLVVGDNHLRQATQMVEASQSNDTTLVEGENNEGQRVWKRI